METIVLDPDEVAVDRTELDINSGGIVVRNEGVDWGNADIEAVMADQQRGSSPIDYRIPNRQIVIPLRIQEDGATTFDEVRAMLQKKVALLQREGGWLGRTLDSGKTIYCDIVNAGLTMSGGWLQDAKGVDIDAELRLEAIPDFYEGEVTLSDHSETTLPEITFTETDLRGDYGARVRLVVDEDDGENQTALFWSIRSRNYSSDSTARMAYQAEELTPLDAAAATALSGASGGTVVRHSNLADDWTPVVGTNLSGGSFLTHTGTYRVLARLYSNGGTSTNGGTLQARFVYDVGDLISPTINEAFTMPGGNQFYIADLGEARLDRIATGDHRWQGQIQAKGQGGTISVDRIWLANVDDGYGIIRGNTAGATSLSAFQARDSFEQISGGTLGGKVLSTGGTWSEAGGAGSFTIETAGQTARRTAVSDAAFASGRFAIAGTATFTNVAAQVDVNFSARTIANFGVLVRYVDTSNWMAVGISPQQASAGYLWVYGRNGGGAIEGLNTGGVTGGHSPLLALTSTTYRIKVRVDDRGNWAAWVGFASLPLPSAPTVSGQSTDLATGGVLASGKVGMYDAQTASTANTRNYDNFLVSIPTADAAIFASQSAELSTGAILREDSSGAAYAPASIVTGDLPRLPPAGMEGRTTEVMVKASRGDFDTSPDSGIDDISTRVFYRPSWLYVPD